MIDNPQYNGEWEPAQIDNPNYFEESNPFTKLDTVSGVVIDIWTMQRGIEYDNLYVGVSEDAAYELADSWKVRYDFQSKADKSSSGDSSSDSDTMEQVKSWV